MIVLTAIVLSIAISSYVMKCRNTTNYISFKRSKTCKNFVISKEEYGDYLLIHYMCKGKMYAYITKRHDYFTTLECTKQKILNKSIVFATFVSDENNNLQVVTKKLCRFAGMDGSFYKWHESPLFLRKKVLKAPKNANSIRFIRGNGETGILSLLE